MNNIFNSKKNIKMLKKMQCSKGISLISLLIVIIVIIILAGIVISSLTKTNIFDLANKARFKHNLSEYNSEFNIWSSNQLISNTGKFDPNDIIATKDFCNYQNKTMKDILPDVKDADLDKIEIIDGKVIEISKPIYTDKEITNMIKNENYIPIASSDELNNIRYNTENTFGQKTKWEGKYLGGVDKKYIQVQNVIMTNYTKNDGWIPIQQDNGANVEPTYFSGTFDGGGYKILGLYINENDSNINDKDSAIGIGLFSKVISDQTEFRNINIEGFNININITNYITEVDAGSLLGIADNNLKTFDNINVNGRMNASAFVYPGGIVGKLGDYQNGNELGQTISNCSVDVTFNSAYVGGIATYIESKSKIIFKNINIKGKNIHNDSIMGGGIGMRIESASSISFENCNSSLSFASNDNNAGGFAFECISSINSDSFLCMKDCHVTADLGSNTALNHNHIGGLFYRYSCSSPFNTNLNIYFSNCSYEGNLKNSYSMCGGLFGTLDANENIVNIDNSYSTGYTSSDGPSIGGIIGYLECKCINLINCYSKMKLTTNNNILIGGLIGNACSYCVNMNNCYYIGNIDNIIRNKTNYNSNPSDSVGGLIGEINDVKYDDSNISNCYVISDIDAKCSKEVGGLIGACYISNTKKMTIKNCYYKGNIRSYFKTGGILGNIYIYDGNNPTIIENSYVEGTIDGSMSIGGIVGCNDSAAFEINNSHFNGNINVTYSDSNYNIGGIIGDANNNILVQNSYFNGNINLSTQACDKIGGIIGYAKDFTIDKCYTLSNLNMDNNCNNDLIGGLIGDTDGNGNIKNSYVIGDFSTNGHFGGIVGSATANTNISYCYSVFTLKNLNNLEQGINGSGSTINTISTYWNKETSNISGDLSNSIGKTTEELKNKSTYDGWDFENIWQINNNVNNGYPYFKDIKNT